MEGCLPSKHASPCCLLTFGEIFQKSHRATAQEAQNEEVPTDSRCPLSQHSIASPVCPVGGEVSRMVPE